MAGMWGLTVEEGAALLGISARTSHRWFREQRPDQLRPDTLERISHLIGIWENLAAVFGQGEPATTWLKLSNSDFGGQPPLQRMLHGNVQDLVFVRNYLDRARQGW
jgi:uncharacterized protein (DUF2384 family)